MSEKRKLRKGKVILTIISIIILIAVVVIIALIVKNKNKINPDVSGNEEKKSEVYQLPDVTYSDMKVTDIEMEYLKNNNETMVSMVIDNTTENTVEKEKFIAVLLDKDGNKLGETETYIDYLVPGQQYSISVILKGDLTATTQIQLQK